MHLIAVVNSKKFIQLNKYWPVGSLEALAKWHLQLVKPLRLRLDHIIYKKHYLKFFFQ